MTEKKCRWGVLGAAAIAMKNWDSIRNSGNGQVVAIASRSKERSEAFIDACQLSRPVAERPDAVEGYQALLDRDDIDAVYIPLPTGLRKEWVIKAAQAGKHVMCEKPCAVSVSDLNEMLDACRENDVQFMDGVMYMHSKRLAALRDVIDDENNLGQLRRIQTHFSFCAPDEFIQNNIRVSSDLEPQGCVGDLGWYTIRMCLFVMNYQLPKTVSGRQLGEHGRADSPNPVPMEFVGELQFDGGVSAGFYNSFRTEHQQLVHVSGTKGNLQLHDFVLPYFGNELGFEVNKPVFNVNGCEFVMERHRTQHTIAEYSNNAPDAQEVNLFRNFSNIVLSGEIDPFWPEASLKTQIVMDACLASARQGGATIELTE
ncbi:1,5-anhydro-D-fructose reductase [Thalassoglobus neptunius]|uniref:1,5-anhydro-D-fructose reductase n=1 Tax=Thalassoglobus neptunius TaxID=1938619 RepID=A0A5C5WJ02_9PLAN|nr:Gfo/Idh/MocA family oxidoreductase [Thalassoglobus neptunius]TWT49812.1 1,5-anhydro-D-fructose reductase [Thalassoglobus neptunius]